jgi:hypothetical protein
MSVYNLELLRHMLDEINFVLHYTYHKTKIQVTGDEV